MSNLELKKASNKVKLSFSLLPLERGDFSVTRKKFNLLKLVLIAVFKLSLSVSIRLISTPSLNAVILNSFINQQSKIASLKGIVTNKQNIGRFFYLLEPRAQLKINQVNILSSLSLISLKKRRLSLEHREKITFNRPLQQTTKGNTSRLTKAGLAAYSGKHLGLQLSAVLINKRFNFTSITQIMLNLLKQKFNTKKFQDKASAFKLIIRGKTSLSVLRKTKTTYSVGRLQSQNFVSSLQVSKEQFHINSTGKRNLKVVVSL